MFRPHLNQVFSKHADLLLKASVDIVKRLVLFIDQVEVSV